YNDTDSTATITATITYTAQVLTQQNLSIAIVEDSIIDLTEIPTGEEEHYIFTNVFRGMVPAAPYGDPLLSTLDVNEPGRVNRRIYTYKVNPAWNASHCRVVAFVHYSNTEERKDVIQSVQTKLVQ